jgi:hypothetical protein
MPLSREEQRRAAFAKNVADSQLRGMQVRAPTVPMCSAEELERKSSLPEPFCDFRLIAFRGYRSVRQLQHAAFAIFYRVSLYRVGSKHGRTGGGAHGAHNSIGLQTPFANGIKAIICGPPVFQAWSQQISIGQARVSLVSPCH